MLLLNTDTNMTILTTPTPFLPLPLPPLFYPLPPSADQMHSFVVCYKQYNYKFIVMFFFFIKARRLISIAPFTHFI